MKIGQRLVGALNLKAVLDVDVRLSILAGCSSEAEADVRTGADSY